jgi:acetate kinase
MNILIFNCGSSSQTFKVYQACGQEDAALILAGKAKNVATRTKGSAILTWTYQGRSASKTLDLSSHRLVAQQIIAVLKENQVSVHAIGHRFVHGGPYFSKTVRVDDRVAQTLRQCFPFAPIHNPNSFSVIEACQELLPGLPQFAVFDTAFHAGMPQVSKQYAIPQELAEKYGFYKYGFHGLSCQYVSARAAELLGKPLASLKLILCHLGSGGSSVTAVKDGKTLQTSMGYSPLTGLVMSTRCGDIDAEIVLRLIREGYSAESVEDILNNQSGLIGLSGYSSNLEEIIQAAGQGHAACQLAYQVYVQRLQGYLGAFSWLLNGADAIIFTDELGVQSWQLRETVCSQAEHLGVVLDVERNRRAAHDRPGPVSSEQSRTQIWVIPTDEESVILSEVQAQLKDEQA